MSRKRVSIEHRKQTRCKFEDLTFSHTMR